MKHGASDPGDGQAPGYGDTFVDPLERLLGGGYGLRKYGWALVLFVGVPFLALYTRTVYDAAFDSGLVSHETFYYAPGLPGATTTVLLGILYPLMRRTDQATLRLVWTCTLAVAAIGTLVFYGSVLADDSPFVGSSWTTPLIALFSLLPLVWFAREASRQSLAHAYFLLFIVGGLTLPNLSQSLPLDFRWLWGLVEAVPAVWLLANFGLRGPTFRRWSVIVLAVLQGIVLLRLLVVGVTLMAPIAVLLSLLPFALIYFVRVRQPAAKTPTPSQQS